jgi:hypothetical protein
MRPGNLLPLYVFGYFIGRLWIEALRVDTASIIFGLRVNIWLSIIGIGGSLLTFAVRGVRRRPTDSDEPYADGHRWVPESEATESSQPTDPARTETAATDPEPTNTAPTTTDQESDHESL